MTAPPPGPWPPQGTPPPGAPQFGAPQFGPPTFDPPQPPRPEPPVDVVTAFQLLCGFAVLGVVNMIASLLAVYADRDSFVDQLLSEVAAQDPNVQIGRDTAEALLVAGLGLTALIGLGATALYLLFVFKMRAGRNWARMLVTMLGVMTVFFAVPTLFGLGAGGGAAAIVAGGAGILQAVLVVGAIVLMHRADSNRYFLPGVRPR